MLLPGSGAHPRRLAQGPLGTIPYLPTRPLPISYAPDVYYPTRSMLATLPTHYLFPYAPATYLPTHPIPISPTLSRHTSLKAPNTRGGNPFSSTIAGKSA
eukprot:3130400-Rhodomonas_salina.2